MREHSKNPKNKFEKIKNNACNNSQIKLRKRME